MKKNTERLLQALYPAKIKSWGLPLSVLYDLLPEFTPGGKRSTLHLLKTENYVSISKVGQTSFVYSTDKGRELVEREFQALSSRWEAWNGQWGCCIFSKATSFDRQFRFLRQLILKEGMFAVSRGVYFAPYPFSSVLMSELGERYASATAVFTIAEWQFEREHSFVLRELGIADVLSAYSSISNEIDQLLKVVQGSGLATDQQKLQIRTVFNRFWDALGQDPGFATHYDPLRNSPTLILEKLQHLMQHL